MAVIGTVVIMMNDVVGGNNMSNEEKKNHLIHLLRERDDWLGSHKKSPRNS